MDYLQVIAAESGRFLSPGGFVAVEIGYDQAEKVKTALLSYGFADVAAFRDFNDHERVIVGWKHG
jgi:release factor glutamine methyltransferase